VEHVSAKLGISERLACRVLEQHRSTQRKTPKMADDEVALTAAIIDWARQYGRYGSSSDHRPAAGRGMGLQPQAG
jgi:putative transposase